MKYTRVRDDPMYGRWQSMKARCYNPKHPKYPRYGGRGIEVCERWLRSFSNYLHDVGRPPEKGYQLDRIDNNGDYSPDNVRWCSQTENIRNASCTIACDLWVRIWFRLYMLGRPWSHEEIGKTFGVDKHTVRKALSGINWVGVLSEEELAECSNRSKEAMVENGIYAGSNMRRCHRGFYASS